MPLQDVFFAFLNTSMVCTQAINAIHYTHTRKKLLQIKHRTFSVHPNANLMAFTCFQLTYLYM